MNAAICRFMLLLLILSLQICFIYFYFVKLMFLEGFSKLKQKFITWVISLAGVSEWCFLNFICLVLPMFPGIFTAVWKTRAENTRDWILWIAVTIAFHSRHSTYRTTYWTPTLPTPKRAAPGREVYIGRLSGLCNQSSTQSFLLRKEAPSGENWDRSRNIPRKYTHISAKGEWDFYKLTVAKLQTACDLCSPLVMLSGCPNCCWHI